MFVALQCYISTEVVYDKIHFSIFGYQKYFPRKRFLTKKKKNDFFIG